MTTYANRFDSIRESRKSQESITRSRSYTSPERRARSKPRPPRALSTLILHETRGHGAIEPHHELMSRRPAPLLTCEAAEKKRALRTSALLEVVALPRRGRKSLRGVVHVELDPLQQKP